MSSHAHTAPFERKAPESHALAAVVAVLLGILVAVLGPFALFTWLDARSAREAADRAAAKAATATPAHAFAAVDRGQVGLLKVSHVAGTMSH
jgi:hypothetical protein